MTKTEAAELLIALDILEKLSKEMAREFSEDGLSWPRAWMIKHASARNTIINARQVMMDRLQSCGAPEAATAEGS
tara:strand:+ start:23493 stop:23717 length:225 start_codon:yes stop_codon:yes gene_type:complete